MIGLSAEEVIRYSDTIKIPEIGLQGQEAIKKSSALVIGLGGLGSIVAQYLSAAGVGRLGLMDNDFVTLSNLQRQIIHGTHKIGISKIKSASQRLLELNPNVHLEQYEQALSEENASRIIAEYDVIVGCTDNYSSYSQINESCVDSGKPYIFGAVSRFEGQIGIFYSPKGACYHCIFPGSHPEQDNDYPYEGVFTPVPGVIGSIQAVECLKLMLDFEKPLFSKIILYNALDASFYDVILEKDPRCTVCSR